MEKNKNDTPNKRSEQLIDTVGHDTNVTKAMAKYYDKNQSK